MSHASSSHYSVSVYFFGFGASVHEVQFETERYIKGCYCVQATAMQFLAGRLYIANSRLR